MFIASLSPNFVTSASRGALFIKIHFYIIFQFSVYGLLLSLLLTLGFCYTKKLIYFSFGSKLSLTKEKKHKKKSLIRLAVYCKSNKQKQVTKREETFLSRKSTQTHTYIHKTNKQKKSLMCFAVVARVRRTENKERNLGENRFFFLRKTHKVEKEFREESRLITRTVNFFLI